ncbi:aspartate 1-decarboxylase [Polycladomyces subterraneus]|uniref:Aspartate 1-decarboxylase n=1 Tax=Polycladomyces subterraneus TaxID=1016997 RepID=A0ABT8IL14_9BACL|nr:aspartate 1-decarboxylase [Polycladomyces subterraneus]MDN4593087.1 aspartate 1-decarboxylase [Polycladomyces subterraneus]
MLHMTCKGKIHRARVTEANLDYVGSITIDEQLMEAASIRPFEMVQINGLRSAQTWQTYAIPAPFGSGEICVNGPPAHLFRVGDLVIILSIGFYTESDLERFQHLIVLVDEKNHLVDVKSYTQHSAHHIRGGDGK